MKSCEKCNKKSKTDSNYVTPVMITKVKHQNQKQTHQNRFMSKMLSLEP